MAQLGKIQCMFKVFMRMQQSDTFSYCVFAPIRRYHAEIIQWFQTYIQQNHSSKFPNVTLQFDSCSLHFFISFHVSGYETGCAYIHELLNMDNLVSQIITIPLQQTTYTVVKTVDLSGAEIKKKIPNTYMEDHSFYIYGTPIEKSIVFTPPSQEGATPS